MKLDFPTILGVSTVFILCIFASSIVFWENSTPNTVVNSKSAINSVSRNSIALSEINQQAIIFQQNNQSEKFSEQKKLMHGKLEEISRNTLDLNIYIDKNYWHFFPIVDRQPAEIQNEKPIEDCNVAKNIPIHLQKIKNTKMFEIFAKKYSGYPIELNIQDERNYESSFHYGLIAKSDENRSALTYFHVNSCTNKILDSDEFFLSCHNDQTREVFGTKNRNDILASLNHEDFCIIPLDESRQAFYEYGKKLSAKEEQYIRQLENVKYNDEKVETLQSEMHQINKLHDLVMMIVSGTVDDKTIQEKIQYYIKAYGYLPDDFLELFEQKK